jgi:uncharacterized DUF497 family protein
MSWPFERLRLSKTSGKSIRPTWRRWPVVDRERVLAKIDHNALGRTEAGRYLSVFFIRILGNKALIITARDMNRNERKRYEKG